MSESIAVGQVPPDFSSPSGQFRLLAQDTHSVDLNPAQPGLGQYDLFADYEIAGFLAIYQGQSMYRAVGAAYYGLSARAALDAKLIKDYDLQVDSTKRAAALESVAQAMFALADKEDALSGANSGFDLTPSMPDWREELNYSVPGRWGVSPLEFALGEGAIGFAGAYSIAEIGEGDEGQGITVTDGSSD